MAVYDFCVKIAIPWNTRRFYGIRERLSSLHGGRHKDPKTKLIRAKI